MSGTRIYCKATDCGWYTGGPGGGGTAGGATSCPDMRAREGQPRCLLSLVCSHRFTDDDEGRALDAAMATYAGIPGEQMLEPLRAMFDEAPQDWWRFVPCGTCNSDRQEPCQAAMGPARGPHASRIAVARVLHGTLWLLTNGFQSDVLPSPDPAHQEA